LYRYSAVRLKHTPVGDDVNLNMLAMATMGYTVGLLYKLNPVEPVA
jgi:hypothetical protein